MRATGAWLKQEPSLFGSSRTQRGYLRSSDPKRPTADVIQDFESVGAVSPPSLPFRNVTMLMLQLELLTSVFKRLRSAGGHLSDAAGAEKIGSFLQLEGARKDEIPA